MSADRIEIRLGRVVHVKPCPEQCERGMYISCSHGANCPCVGSAYDCERCDGAGELLDEDCTCDGCVHLFTRFMERMTHADLQ